MSRTECNDIVDELKNEWNYFRVPRAVVARDHVHHVALHDTGEHVDYFSASFMKILTIEEARKAKYIRGF